MESANGTSALRQLGLAVVSIALFCAAVSVTFASDFIEVALPLLLLLAALAAAAAAIRQSPGHPWRDAFQLGFAWLLFGFVVSALTPGPASDRHGKRTACLSNVKQQAIGMLMYAADFDDRFPLADSWHSGLQPIVKFEFYCPYATSAWSYAMNHSMSGVLGESVEQPERQVLLFEADAALPDASGGREWLVFRHVYPEEKRTMIGFVDGHAKAHNAAQTATLLW